MDTMMLAGFLVLLALIAFNRTSPKAQPPQIIYVRTDPRELKRDEGGCLPMVVFVLVVIVAISLL